MESTEEKRPVLHIAVVGFHHQRGSEVEFSFPPVINGDDNWSRNLPEEWRHLPFMALPDGAHNYDSDTTFFHLPYLNSRPGKKKTLYGVSCYRQMDSKDLKNKCDDVTRTTVQKAVCVLSQMPVYGYIQAKLEVATKVYFEEKDFSRVGILKVSM
ncbi:predicted protein [Nematostella vectensis]|uniref:UDENN domain-containing protein n=1 Tax=Nematostella vectensis TaxID=45351 RepID=A7SFB8_NEMVE|nr:predicted protein [Nematostella vectensis]|eukprot:XP_001629658.1 predicted protein [Nematostella vectensis]